MQGRIYRIGREASHAPRRSGRPRKAKTAGDGQPMAENAERADREIFTRTDDSLYAARGLVEKGGNFAAEQMYHRMRVPEKEAFTRIAEICLERQRYETAALYFRKAEQFEKAGDALLAAGKFFAAGKCFWDAGSGEKASGAFNKGGVMAVKAKNYGIALECFKRADNHELAEKTAAMIRKLECRGRASIDSIRQGQQQPSIPDFRKS